MKIASYQVMTLAVPEDDPLANMPEDANRKRPTVILRLRTDSGIEGIGVTLYGGRVTRSLHAMMEDLCAGIVGENYQIRFKPRLDSSDAVVLASGVSGPDSVKADRLRYGDRLLHSETVP